MLNLLSIQEDSVSVKKNRHFVIEANFTNKIKRNFTCFQTNFMSAVKNSMTTDICWNPLFPCLTHTPYSWFGPAELNDSLVQDRVLASKQEQALIQNHQHSTLLATAHFPNKRDQTDQEHMLPKLCEPCHQSLVHMQCQNPKCYFNVHFVHTRFGCNKRPIKDSPKEEKEEPLDSPESHRYKCIVSYDGTGYEGWQSQPNGQTVQDKIEKRMESYFHKRIVVVGSGRTDTGVHAKGQVFHFDLPLNTKIELGKKPVVVPESTFDASSNCIGLMKLFQSLPDDILVTNVECISQTFHSRFSCLGKQYIYHIYSSSRLPPFRALYMWNIPHYKFDEEDIQNMQAACKVLTGEHNFLAFTVLDTKNGETKTLTQQYRFEENKAVKRMKLVSLHINENDSKHMTISMIGNRFLYKMARSIVGTIVEVGLKKLQVEQLEQILKGKKRTRQVVTAPAKGLFLKKVFFEQQDYDHSDQFSITELFSV
ncbi:tRNA-pseudouridine synthase I [Reticulomyxa filosa]|uniref:tRNA pseudouridine synthase n=1 Tax=Reticulomyxa filosa TaxID=46433 RepID=X6M8V8_RETFI|nr:tRNA-pseudouridine synthase I [Reticulomyxa filosa]|eukprot:ETO10418.1 tRNA-pseudouridine synthase I [Reticulomyxa filosa]